MNKPRRPTDADRGSIGIASDSFLITDDDPASLKLYNCLGSALGVQQQLGDDPKGILGQPLAVCPTTTLPVIALYERDAFDPLAAQMTTRHFAKRLADPRAEVVPRGGWYESKCGSGRQVSDVRVVHRLPALISRYGRVIGYWVLDPATQLHRSSRVDIMDVIGRI